MKNIYKAIKIIQNERPILLFSLPAYKLKEIAYFNPREIDRESGIQRDYKTSRSRDIATYVDSDDSTLSNNIIINLELSNFGLSIEDVYDNKVSKLDYAKLLKANSSKRNIKSKIAFVVDGQHRLRAFDYAKNKRFPLIISAFIDLSLAEVAEIFVSINFNQKPVNKSHVFDLLGISRNIFPKYWKLHQLVQDLNDDLGSPFYGKIKMLGAGQGYISQASMITAIEKYKIEKTLFEYEINPSKSVLYDVIWTFFTSVENVLPDFWGEKRFLSKTVGIRALFCLLNKLLDRFLSKEIEFNTKNIEMKIHKINQNSLRKKSELKYIGESGVKELYGVLEKDIFY